MKIGICSVCGRKENLGIDDRCENCVRGDLNDKEEKS